MSPVPATTLEILIQYAKLGLNVLPINGIRSDGSCTCPDRGACKAKGKHPNGVLVRHGAKEASTNEELVREWIKRGAALNWGIATGHALASGGYLLVLDVDPRNGGDDSLIDLELANGALPKTATAKTGGGGAHYYFYTDNPVQGTVLAPGLDVKALGGYVVCEPSTHASGGRYEWEASRHVLDTPIAKAPDWLLGRAPVEQIIEWDGVASAKQSLLGAAFEHAGMLGVEIGKGRWAVKCPWQHEHSDGRGDGNDSSTSIMPPTTEHQFGAFVCRHEHCRERGWKDVMEVLPPESLRHARGKYGPRPVAEAPKEPQTVLEADAPKEIEGKKPQKRKRHVMAPNGGLTVEQLEKVREHLLYVEDRSGNFKLRKDIVNVVGLLRYDPRWKDLLQFNTFANRVMITGPCPWHPDDVPSAYDAVEYPVPWADEDDIRLSIWFERYWGIAVSKDRVREAVITVAQTHSFHPVREYLDGLKWDGVPRLEKFASTYLGADDSEYNNKVCRWWMISAIARVYEPGCKADHVLILEGSQGVGKSSAARALTGARWFSDTGIDLNSKDAYLSIQGRWVLELAELDSLNRADANRAKMFFSSPSDVYRPPYGHSTVEIPRQCVFIGTVNHFQYLRDETGNRRYWGVRCGGVDLVSISRDRDQLWAEARELYKAGVKWWPETPYEREMCETEQADRAVSDTWEAILGEWATSPAGKACLKKGYVTPQELLKSAIGIEQSRWTAGDAIRLGRATSRLSWARRRHQVFGTRIWVYVPPGTPILTEG